MSAKVHSFGPTCVYYDEENDNHASNGDTAQRIKAQFFYISSLPIDDPLSPLPPISADQAHRQPPQPFSARDNAALEEAWQAMRAGESSSSGLGQNYQTRDIPSAAGPLVNEYSMQTPLPSGSSAASSRNKPTEMISSGLSRPSHRFRRFLSGEKRTSGKQGASSVDERIQDNEESSQPTSDYENGKRVDRSHVMLDQETADIQHGSNTITTRELQSMETLTSQASSQVESKRKRQFSPFRRREESPQKRSIVSQSPGTKPSVELLGTSSSSQNAFQPASDINGRPFARAPSQRNIRTSFATPEDDRNFSSDEGEKMKSTSSKKARGKDSEKHNPNTTFVPVGISRLHLVEMPDLMMKPIYWSPINDTSNVMRATWFYMDTMMPVPVDVANRLEIGYEELKPFTSAYQEEIQACIDNGPAAELKIVHKLWNESVSPSRPVSAVDGKTTNELATEDPEEAPAMPTSLQNAAVDSRKGSKKRQFESYSVIYIDSTNAQILKPSLLPSVRQNRTPLSSIRKGRQIGIAVVRGFDRKAWFKANPNPKLNAEIAHAKVGAYMSQSGDATTRKSRQSCQVCDRNTETPQATDLVLVIHGIGQKLSERMDSFHFTHAINGLRREFNVELASEAVKGNLKDTGGIMVLPVNWRLTLSFEDDPKSTEAAAENSYTLQGITPDSLPAVRSLISDVMLDIPYYMSHHKQKMIEAVIREANRIYKLWCRNNPGFEKYGRMHLVAHSLGSVMAMEILSQQPTRLSESEVPTSVQPSEKHFEFDTTNLFCCGSPSGFFLLLNGANLIPRRDRNKAGMEGEDHGRGVAGTAGTYGCLAVDNLYNICHRNDPIAYLQNACVDSAYANSLESASIPSASVGMFQRLGNTLRWSSNSLADGYTTKAAPSRPQVQHMPSTVELETHNFSREEIAEKRMYLLNDNGQIDFFLSSGGGPLEIQYLNMLGAHSSYWLLQDFVRFLVVEIGRKPGRENTIPALRARKKREYKKGTLA